MRPLLLVLLPLGIWSQMPELPRNKNVDNEMGARATNASEHVWNSSFQYDGTVPKSRILIYNLFKYIFTAFSIYMYFLCDYIYVSIFLLNILTNKYIKSPQLKNYKRYRIFQTSSIFLIESHGCKGKSVSFSTTGIDSHCGNFLSS